MKTLLFVLIVCFFNIVFGGFTSSSNWIAYDASNTNGLNTIGYSGAIFDGKRYIYFSPNSGGNYNKIVLRHDTTSTFTNPNSWSAYDPSTTNGLHCVGYNGGVFDGKFVYFSPDYNSNGPHGIVLRYDTTQSFTNSSSWSAYNAGNTNGFVSVGYSGAVYDGKFVYFVPWNIYSSGKTIFLRYDTTMSFNSASSWNAYNALNVSSAIYFYGYRGAVYDGKKYIYFSPFYSYNFLGIIFRYDTTSSFNSSTSWTSYNNTNGLTTVGYAGAIFDGRYIYFIPYQNSNFGPNGVVLRYDTTSSFNSPTSWSTYNASNTNGLDTTGFYSASFDGQYVYFGSYQDISSGSFTGNVLRYDTTTSFNSSTSWSAYDASNTGSLSANGFDGSAFDGRYVYFLASYKNQGLATIVVRYDTGIIPTPPTPQPTPFPTPQIQISTTSTNNNLSFSSSYPQNSTISSITSQSNNLAIIIGSVVGVLILIVLLIVVIAIGFVYYRKQKSTNKRTEIELSQQQGKQQYQSTIDVKSNNTDNQYQKVILINPPANQYDLFLRTQEKQIKNQQQYQAIPNFSKETKSNYNQYLNASSIKNSNFRIPKEIAIDISEIKFESKLGEGNFGVVFLATQNNKKVACKLLKSNDMEPQNIKIDIDAKSIQEFLEEAKTMMKIPQHKNVINLIGICSDPLCIVTEYLEGGNLQQCLSSPQQLVSLDECMKFIKEICMGLQHLHQNAIIHR